MLFLYFLRSQRPHPLQLLSTVKSVHKNFFYRFHLVCLQTRFDVDVYFLLIVIHSTTTISVSLGFAWTKGLLFFHFSLKCASHFLEYSFCRNLVVRFTVASIFLFILGPVVTLTERPDPPNNLEMTDQTERGVRLTWIPGDEHNSPIESKKLLWGFNF